MPKGFNASIAYSGSAETFQNDSVGTFTYSSFPIGWHDPAQVDPNSEAPQPSAVVIKTTDAQGHITQALATFPAVADSQGIYRPIGSSDFYATRADVRVDQFGKIDPAVAVEDPNSPGVLLCGCPVGTENLLDWPMQISFAYLDGAADLGHSPAAGILASSETHTWHLFSGTANIVADIDLGLEVEEGKWYGVETDFNAANGALHGVITDATTGTTLADTKVFLTDPKYGTYDPNVDGVFNVEAYIDGEATLVHTADATLDKPGLAVIDNIDTMNQHSGNGQGYGFDDHDHGNSHGYGFHGHDHGHYNVQWRDSIVSDNG